jgi:hypothetical protein
MFHQLRCLNVIRSAVAGDSSISQEHQTHCLNYLRQMVLCRGSTFTESIRGPVEDREVVRESYTCRDWEAVYRELNNNLVSNGIM